MNKGKIERAAANDEKKLYDLEKIESAAVRSVEEYIEGFSKMKSYIFTNDKIPIWDGEIYVHNNNIKEKRTNENFFAKTPIQVKGTTNTTDNFYRIGREHLVGYKKERGTIFFLVQEDENLKPIKILYNMLSLDVLDTMLEKDTQTIKIDLKELPKNPLDFEKEIFEFARKRNGEKIENPATKEIESLVTEFEKIENDIEKIKNIRKRNELKFLLKEIKELKNGNTIGWRDKFVYYSQKAIELVMNNIKDYDFTYLQFELGTYLHEQKLYHLVEDYYLKVLEKCREQANDLPYNFIKCGLANTLNNLANLHADLNRPDEAEKEYQEALEIRRGIAKDNPATYMGDVATTLHNLATLHADLNRLTEAEKECQEALEIRRELAKDDPVTYMGYVAMTLNNLAVIHQNLNRPNEALGEHQKALKISRGLTKDNPTAYMGYVAMSLNNLGLLHAYLNRPVEAEGEYKEALEIYRKLTKGNPTAYKGDMANTLNNLAILHQNLNRPVEAEDEYKEALKIRRELAEDNPAAYMGYVAATLNGLGLLHSNLKRHKEAEDEYKEALKIRRELAKDNPAAYMDKVAMTLYFLAILHSNLERHKEAEEEYKEVLEIWRSLAQANPAAYMDKVAMTLNTLANLHAYLNRPDEAHGERQEALEIRKKFV